MEVKKGPKKPLIYYMIISIMAVLLLNTFIFPFILDQKVKQVDYGTFLTQIENGSVSSVEIQENQIGYTALDERGSEQVFVTGRMDDPELVNRLYDAKVEFTKVIPKETSPLVKFLLAWILPLVIFIAIGQFFARKLQSKIGGGSAETASKIDAEVLKIIKSCHQKAKEILEENIQKLHELTKYLLEKETITGDEFMAILTAKD